MRDGRRSVKRASVGMREKNKKNIMRSRINFVEGRSIIGNQDKQDRQDKGVILNDSQCGNYHHHHSSHQSVDYQSSESGGAEEAAAAFGNSHRQQNSIDARSRRKTVVVASRRVKAKQTCKKQ